MSKKNNNNKSNSLDREEFGFGYDVSPDDLDVYVQNNINQKKKNNEIIEKTNSNKREK